MIHSANKSLFRLVSGKMMITVLNDVCNSVVSNICNVIVTVFDVLYTFTCAVSYRAMPQLSYCHFKSSAAILLHFLIGRLYITVLD